MSAAITPLPIRLYDVALSLEQGHFYL